jgi:hypothetical protein
MGEFLESIITAIPPPFNMVVMIVLICTTAGVVTGIAKQVRKYACHREEIELKREMLESGIPVDEIERVIRAKRSDA